MKQSVALLLVASAAGAFAQQPAWAQCGGNNWTGGTSCVSGYVCTFSNEWYSQCVPGSGGGGSTTTGRTTSRTTTRASTVTTTRTTTRATTTGGGSPPPTGFPASAGATSYPTARVISGSFDGGMLRYDRNPNSCQGQTETDEAAAMFILEAGATIRNAIIGPAQGEGIHCRGTCTLENIWWLDVCEDAATFKHTSGTSYVIGGGAKGADDKIFQFNGRGTVSISGFYAEDYGKVVRNCGDCSNNGGPRHIIIDRVNAKNGGVLCGINSNYGDTCRISNSCQAEGKTCDRYTGVVKGNGSSTKIGSGPDGVSCFVTNPTC